MKFKVIAALFVLSAITLTPNSASADSVQVRTIDTANAVSLDTSLYLPKKVPAPAILIAHGFGGSKDSVAKDAQYFVDKGFAVLTWTARGFGKSTGQISMNSPDAEVADTKALISYLARNKNILQDRSGDPRVGIMGSSYGGANALMTASADSRIDAVIADITWNDLQSDLFPQSAAGVTTPGPFKKVWAGTFFSAVSLQGAYLGECGTFTQAWCDAYSSAAINGKPTAAESNLLKSVSPMNYLQKISAPTLLSQGQVDSLFPLTESFNSAKIIEKANPKIPLALM